MAPLRAAGQASIVGNELSLSFPTTAGRSYEVESRADMTASEWTTVPGTTRVGNGAAIGLTLTKTVNQRHQFYRVKEMP